MSRHAAAFAPPLDLVEGRKNLIGLSRADLTAEIASLGEKPFRARQLWHWIYHRGARDFAEMTTLSKDFRARLAEHYVLSRPAGGAPPGLPRRHHQMAARTGDGQQMEMVHIPEEDRGALCVSSQVGCTLTCRFCHTGTQRLVRNLSAAEIVGQVMVARDELGEWPAPAEGRKLTNIVLMGMGEPLYNYENLATALKIVMDNEGIAISKRKITLSTSGVVPEMVRRRRGAGGQPGGLPARRARRAARRDHADQQEVPAGGAAGRLPRLPRAQQVPAHHLRVRDAEGRQRQRRRRPRPGEAAGRHSGQGQPDPLQPLARRALSNAPSRETIERVSPTSFRAPTSPPPSAPPAATTSWPPAAS